MEEIEKITQSISGFKTGLYKALSSAGYLIGIILGIIGLVIIIIELDTFYSVQQIESWPIIKDGGTIIESYFENTTDYYGYSIFVVSQTFYGQYYRNRLAFSYEIDGKKYIGTQYSYYEPWHRNPMVAKIQNKNFKPGTKVDIRINPNNPGEAYIANKPYNNYVKLTAGIILAVIGIYTIYYL